MGSKTVKYFCRVAGGRKEEVAAVLAGYEVAVLLL